MKYQLSFYLFFFSFVILAQDKYSKEFSFITDNDLYVSTVRDRYYTSGIFLSYRYLSKNENEKLDKKVIEWQIGHEMYTPNNANVSKIEDHDRPFAAYLYGSLGIKRVYKKNKIFSSTLQLGVIGPNAIGKELQSFIHQFYNFKETVGWKHQIKNAFAVNLDLEYSSLISKSKSDVLDISWINYARLGTVYTNICSGVNMRLGFIPLQKMLNSIAFGTNLNNKNTNFKREAEAFFYVMPTLRYSLYDATLQGSFLNKGSEVTKELVPLVFNIELGLKFTANRFNFGYIFNYNTSKSKELRYTYGNKYGSIIVNYLLR